MKIKNRILLLSYIFFLTTNNTYSQEIYLAITSKIKKEQIVLNKIEYKKKHQDSITLNIEIGEISNKLKNLGYFMNTTHKIERENKKHVAFFSLKEKTENAILKINKADKIYFKNSELKDKTISVPISRLQRTLDDISKKLESESKSFAKIQLKNIIIKEKNLFADLDIFQSKKRIINKVIVKGYNNFPKSYLKNYYDLKENTLFNQQKIKEISDASKKLQIISEIKKPEILFTKDSTHLYLYLKKEQINSFNGIVSFASKENGNVLFNGNINLSLNNILDTGEKIELFWNSIGEEKQEFKLSSEIPYTFNSKISPKLSFAIYKQDSTFMSTKFDSKFFYSINQRTKVAITYNSETSENLKKDLFNNIETFTNYFLGFQFQLKIPKKDFFYNDKFYLAVNPTFGKRRTSQDSSSQFKIEITTSFIWDLNLRNNIYIKNKTGYLNSDSLINNELFRLGGENSIRGFDEQSLFTNKYSYLNIEYRYLTSTKSYLYTITDIGRIKTNSRDKNLFGLGMGYIFTNKKSQININITTNNQTNQTIDLKRVKLTINWTNFF